MSTQPLSVVIYNVCCIRIELVVWCFFRYVWEHLEIGYMQGMCDLVAPLLVIFDDESLSYSCFCRLMERMIENFPSGNAMDMHLANMRYCIE